MCLTWREDWTLPHCHKAQIVGVLQWCLSFCRFLLSPHMIVEFNYCDHQVLRHHSNQSLHHQWFSLARRPALGRVLVVSNFLYLWVTETTCFCDPSMKQIFFWTLPQMCDLAQTCFWALQTVLLTPGLGFCSDMHYQLLDLLRRRVPFQIIPYPFN